MVNNPRYLCAGIAAALAALLGACATSPRAINTAPAIGTIQYPAAARGTVVDDYHGTRIADPYRWFEDPDSQATRDWVVAQNAVSQPYLERLPQRAWLGNRLKQLWTYERFGVPRREGGRYFYLRNDGNQDQSVLYVAESLEARMAAF